MRTMSILFHFFVIYISVIKLRFFCAQILITKPIKMCIRDSRFIVRLCELIKHLAVDKLHIVGDLFDRGPRPDIILDLLMRHHNVDCLLYTSQSAGRDAAHGPQYLRILPDGSGTAALAGPWLPDAGPLRFHSFHR